jgi:hypothetical protein
MKGGNLCRNSHTYARDVIQYIYSKDGKAYSVINREASDLRVQIEIIPRCDAVRGLLRAVDNGLKVRRKKSEGSERRRGTVYVPSGRGSL